MKGILFKAEMVRAILDVRKTMTRRVIKKKLHLDPHNLPYQPGNIIYVKETFAILKNISTKNVGIIYRATNNCDGIKWKSAMFMPEKYSRIHFKITAVRVERLQDITNNEALAEGTPDHRTKENNYDMRDCFRILWDSINGKTYSWESNPWVAVYEFEIVEEEK